MNRVNAPAKALARAGRLKRRSRSARAILFVAGLAAVVMTRQAQAQLNYTVTDLGTLGGSFSAADGINGLGQVVGNATIASGKTEAFLYSNGSMQGLGVLSGFNASVALSLNNNGYVVGGSYNSIGSQAMEWSASTGMVALPGSSGGFPYGTWANSINSSNQIVGSNGESAVLWTSTGPQNLGGLQGGNNAAYAINDSGQVVGYSDVGNSLAHAVQWTIGSPPVNLGTLPGDTASDALGVNNAGQVVGNSQNPSGQIYTPILVTSGQSPQSLGLPSGFVTGSADAINDSGQIVGWAANAVGSGTKHAFVYSGGKITDLNTLLVPSSGWTLNSATGINDAGQIVGTGINAQGKTHAFLLNPLRDAISFYDEAVSPNDFPWVGHAFVQMIPANSAQVSTFCRGFAPTIISPFPVQGKVEDDSAAPWDYKITYYVSDSAYNASVALINHDQVSPPTYSLVSFNCVNWMQCVATAAGITLPPLKTITGIGDPSVFRQSLNNIGNGGTFQGGTVQFAASSSVSSAKPLAGGSSPLDFSYSELEQNGHTNPTTLAQTLDMPLDLVNLGAVNANSLTGITINILNEDPSGALISMNWADGSAYAEQTLQFSHVYAQGTFQADLLIIDDGAVHDYEMEIGVSSDPGATVTINPTSFSPDENPNPGQQPGTAIPDVPEPNGLGILMTFAGLAFLHKRPVRKGSCAYISV